MHAHCHRPLCHPHPKPLSLTRLLCPSDHFAHFPRRAGAGGGLSMGGPGAPLQLAGPRSGLNEVTSQCHVHHRRSEFPLGRAGGPPPFQPPAPLTTAPPPRPPARGPPGNGRCPPPAGGTGSLSALGGRHEEPEAGAGDEEPANPPAGEEDRRAGEAGESRRLPGKAPTLAAPVPVTTGRVGPWAPPRPVLTLSLKALLGDPGGVVADLGGGLAWTPRLDTSPPPVPPL